MSKNSSYDYSYFLALTATYVFTSIRELCHIHLYANQRVIIVFCHSTVCHFSHYGIVCRDALALKSKPLVVRIANWNSWATDSA